MKASRRSFLRAAALTIGLAALNIRMLISETPEYKLPDYPDGEIYVRPDYVGPSNGTKAYPFRTLEEGFKYACKRPDHSTIIMNTSAGNYCFYHCEYTGNIPKIMEMG